MLLIIILNKVQNIQQFFKVQNLGFIKQTRLKIHKLIVCNFIIKLIQSK